jgi:AcrR family transcriptional regulator
VPQRRPHQQGSPVRAGTAAILADVTETLGRREANKLATRQALQQAADRLFAEQGYAATAVRDIAEAAGVTERTFFRYFAGKEELIIDDALNWLPALQELLRVRPASEDPVTALRESVLELASSLAASPRPSPLWLFTDGPPGSRITRMTPGVVLKIEADLAKVIRERLDHPGQTSDTDSATGTATGTGQTSGTGTGQTSGTGSGETSGIDSDYLADILARTTLALIRSSLIRRWQLSEHPPSPADPSSPERLSSPGDTSSPERLSSPADPSSPERPSTTTLINQAFATLQIPPASPAPPPKEGV